MTEIQSKRNTVLYFLLYRYAFKDTVTDQIIRKQKENEENNYEFQ